MEPCAIAWPWALTARLFGPMIQNSRETFSIFPMVSVYALCYACADQGVATEAIDAEDPEQMIQQYDDKFCRMEQTKDFFTTEMYKKYISSNIDPKQIVWRCGKWGILRTPDGKHRDGVPQCVEGEGTGTWSCFNQHFVGQRQHRSMCSQSV